MRECSDIVTTRGYCNKGLICGYGLLLVEAAASRDAMEIQYRVWGDTLSRDRYSACPICGSEGVGVGGGGTLNPRIECPGETLETRCGHFFLG